MSDIIIKNEVPFCELDSHAGDGDFGMSVSKGFKQLIREWKDILSQDNLTIGSFLDASSIMEYCGGASGPIWGSDSGLQVKR
jgi:triose/dihydroxyacetone kinase / FAD-AMP lyase (cyclizing)